jgi:hypothetical protein
MAGSLEFIKSATSTSATSSLQVTDCFSAEYDVYKVVLQVDSVTQEAATNIRLIDSGGVDSTSNYDNASLYMKSTTSFSELNGTGKTSWEYTMYNEGSVGGFFVMYVFNPYDSSSYTFATSQLASHYLASSTSTLVGRKGIFVHKVAEQITGIEAQQGSTRLENATLVVYGVK